MRNSFYKEFLVYKTEESSFNLLLKKVQNYNFFLKRKDLLSIFVKSKKEENNLRKLLKNLSFKEYYLQKPFIPEQIMEDVKVGNLTFSRKGKEGKNRIVLSPGISFGYDHPATLLMVYILFDNKDFLRNFRVLDLGIGSGILSIVVTKLGAKKVLGIDICPFVVKEAIKNIRRNKIRFKGIKVLFKDVSSLKKKFNFIIANVPINVHELLSYHINRLILPHGRVAVGGFIEKEIDLIKEIYWKFKVIKIYKKEEWVGMLMERCEF